MNVMPTLPTDLAETIRDEFRRDRSRMTMMAARKFAVPEQAVVEALIGEWPIVRLRDGIFRELMEALPALGVMRVFVRSRAAVIESVGTFGGFSETGPFFNVQTDTLDMHILHAEIGAIYAVEKWGHDTDDRHPFVPVLRPLGRRRLQGLPLGKFPPSPGRDDCRLPRAGPTLFLTPSGVLASAADGPLTKSLPRARCGRRRRARRR